VSNVEFNDVGEPQFDVIPDSKQNLMTDMVIWAIGQSPDLGVLSNDTSVEVSKRGTIIVDPETLETPRPGVFAGGDVIGGDVGVIDAIAYGKRAAIHINQYLKGEVVKGNQRAEKLHPSDIKVVVPQDITKQKRQVIPEVPVIERSGTFREVSLGLNEEQAVAEAKRCLNCAGNLCKEVCPYSAPQFGAEENPKMQKCDLCIDRWADHKEPICVAACPERALDSGPIDELKAKYGDIQDAEGFIYSLENKPSIIFKPKAKPPSEEI
jgi:heterodisulfide reductase subunit A-like polyferredoxin